MGGGVVWVVGGRGWVVGNAEEGVCGRERVGDAEGDARAGAGGRWRLWAGWELVGGDELGAGEALACARMGGQQGRDDLVEGQFGFLCACVFAECRWRLAVGRLCPSHAVVLFSRAWAEESCV